MHSRSVWRLLAGAFLLAACSKDTDGLPEANARPVTPSGTDTSNGSVGLTTGPARPGGASAAPGMAGAGGRPSPTVTLAASDIGIVRRDTIEEGIAITGDLDPIESVEVRSRIEGDLVGVYVREGQQVRAGQQLARFESSEQESAHTSAQADRVAAESELATAQWNLEQTTELFRAGAVSELDFKTAQQSVTTARARLAAAESRVRAAASLLRDTRVLAPTTGIIASRQVENGEHVSRGASLFTLVRSDALELAVPEEVRDRGRHEARGHDDDRHDDEELDEGEPPESVVSVKPDAGWS